MRFTLLVFLFWLAVTYPLVAIPASGAGQALVLFVVWAAAVVAAMLLARNRDEDDG